jgi:hypothetical protein
VGDSRGEQNGNKYHGRATLAHVNLGAPINIHQDIIGVESNPGESKTGPTGPVNAALGQLCAGSGNAICLAVLPMSSSTSNTGSTNHFGVATADLAGGGGSLHVNAASSDGNISEGNGCQTANGSSQAAGARASLPLPGIPLVNPLTADVLSASSSSTACNNGSQSQTNDSSVLNLSGTGVPVPAAGCPGPNETPNTVFQPFGPLLAIVCNANDSNSGQTSAPYGVREALTTFAALTGNTALVKLTTSATESHAVAPGANGNRNAKNPNGKKGVKGENASGGGAGSAASGAQSGGGSLAFTGENLLLLGLIGAGLISMGVIATAARPRRIG